MPSAHGRRLRRLHLRAMGQSVDSRPNGECRRRGPRRDRARGGRFQVRCRWRIVRGDRSLTSGSNLLSRRLWTGSRSDSPTAGWGAVGGRRGRPADRIRRVPRFERFGSREPKNYPPFDHLVCACKINCYVVLRKVRDVLVGMLTWVLANLQSRRSSRCPASDDRDLEGPPSAIPAGPTRRPAAPARAAFGEGL